MVRLYISKRSYRKLEQEGRVHANLYTDTPTSNEEFVVIDVSQVDYAKGLVPGLQKLVCRPCGESHAGVSALWEFDTRQRAGVHAGAHHGLTLKAAIDKGIILTVLTKP